MTKHTTSQKRQQKTEKTKPSRQGSSHNRHVTKRPTYVQTFFLLPAAIRRGNPNCTSSDPGGNGPPGSYGGILIFVSIPEFNTFPRRLASIALSLVCGTDAALRTDFRPLAKNRLFESINNGDAQDRALVLCPNRNHLCSPCSPHTA